MDSSPIFRRWQSNQSLSALRLNEPLTALEDLLRARPGAQGIGAGELARGYVDQYRFKTMGDDYIECVTYDGTTEGTTTIRVAKPWRLRRTPFDGLSWGGIAYAYTTDVERVADGTETQVVTPPYVADDLILVEQVIVPLMTLSGPVEIINLVDKNNDARAWAVKSA